MSSCTLPLPEPAAPSVTAIHGGALLAAVHEQSGGVVTATVCGPPVAGSPIVSGETTALHPLSWLTVKVWPAAVMLPLRAAEEFAATVNCTVPLPLPLAPEVRLIHGAFATIAVHAHPPAAFTLKDPDAPAAGTVWLAGEIVGEHPLA